CARDVFGSGLDYW
nr:immunoglobulin heavy chain junction region [Macaca mulatta]MOX91447.1 immunoglobulin heavy chain junction region [Macaca mulatta]MOX91454.1 immunoglobulin heavy chain junction region [Macaca mulatta]MOX91455.1 immunoglobulin heavy chain junction region [Macaca mulatta]MOX91459.1 immunoglobulin heavy chain junction region [Macaca mulatta]